jgi:hypothetical protein
MDWSKQRWTFNLGIGIIQTANGVITEITQGLHVGDPSLGVLFGVDVLGQKPDNVANRCKFKNQGQALITKLTYLTLSVPFAFFCCPSSCSASPLSSISLCSSLAFKLLPLRFCLTWLFSK